VFVAPDQFAPDQFAPNSFLAHLDPSERRALSALGTARRYAAKATLFHQGEPSRHVVLLLDGWVKVTSTARSGGEALLALRGPGDILGELSAVDGQPRSATVSALVPVYARVVDGDRFLESLARLPKLALALLAHVAGSLRESDSKRLEYVSSSSSTRLAALVLELAARHGRQTAEGVLIELPLTQRELATAAATSREVVARVLRTLREREVVRTRRRHVIVVQMEVLQSLSGSVPGDT
jgi:CRP-like cAMP-binding protein